MPKREQQEGTAQPEAVKFPLPSVLTQGFEPDKQKRREPVYLALGDCTRTRMQLEIEQAPGENHEASS
jgi:hypothetical protein